MRTGVVELRCDFARDLLRAGRSAGRARGSSTRRSCSTSENPTAEALRGWAALAAGDADRRARARRAGARVGTVVRPRAHRRGRRRAASAATRAAAERAWAPVRERIARKAPPEYVYRPKIAVWEETHTLPAVERRLLDRFSAAAREAAKAQ